VFRGGCFASTTIAAVAANQSHHVWKTAKTLVARLVERLGIRWKQAKYQLAGSAK
jgi:hypothetical protein